MADLARDRGRLIVPHCWKSAIGIAASAHLCAATDCCPFIEYLPADLSESALRAELADDGLTMTDGKIQLPTAPGLGAKIRDGALEQFAAEALVDSTNFSRK